MTYAKVELLRQNQKAGVTLFAMDTITQDMRFKQAAIEYSTQFFKHVVEKFPYAIECVQTDNGFEFTNEMGNSKKEASYSL